MAESEGEVAPGPGTADGRIATPAPPALAFELRHVIGHLLRRAQQTHAALWAQRVPGDITSPQYAVLHTLGRAPGIDQAQLGGLASLDRSTTADIVRRLVGRGLIDRERSTVDARRYELFLSEAGRELLELSTDPALGVNDELMHPLSEQEASTLIYLLQQLVERNGSALWHQEVDGTIPE